MRHAIPIVSFALLSACASAPRSTGTFPTRSELEQLGAAAPPPRAPQDKALEIDAWDLKGPLPDEIDDAPVDDTSAWGKALVEAAAAKQGVVMSRAMGCVARETAAFVADKNAMPATPLRRFIAARCGLPTTHTAIAFQSGKAPEAFSEAEVFAKWGADVKTMLKGSLGAHRFAGVALARKGDRAAVVLVTAPRRVRLEKTPLVPQDGKVLLQGELRQGAANLRALVNKGRFGFARCAVDAGVKLPRFSIACPISADDPTAWIEVAAFPPGRVLGNTVVEALVFPNGKPPGSYTRVRSATPAPDDKAGAITALMGRVNAVRKEAGLAPVRVSAGESRVADRLAPHYFAAVGGYGDETIADRVALGLQAGWDVEGMVREGHFVSAWADERDPEELLDTAFQRPYGREALLDPSVEAVAVGTVVPSDSRALGVVFGTYSIADAARQSSEASAVMDRLSKLRQGKNLAAPEPAAEVQGVASKAALRVQAGEAPDDALKWLVKQAMGSIKKGGVKAWAAQVSSVDRMDLPDELLTMPSVRLAIGAAHYKPEGEPWAKLVVLMVAVVEAEATNTASAGAPHGG